MDMSGFPLSRESLIQTRAAGCFERNGNWKRSFLSGKANVLKQVDIERLRRAGKL